MTWLETFGPECAGAAAGSHHRRDRAGDALARRARDRGEFACGMAHAARAEAMRGFGNLSRMSELAYDVRAGGGLETMWQDCDSACACCPESRLRSGRNPDPRGRHRRDDGDLQLRVCGGPPAAAVPRTRPARLGRRISRRQYGTDRARLSRLARDSNLVEQLAASAGTTANLTGRGEPERINAVRVSGNYFDTLGVPPALGRGFRWSDEPYGHPASRCSEMACGDVALPQIESRGPDNRDQWRAAHRRRHHAAAALAAIDGRATVATAGSHTTGAAVARCAFPERPAACGAA